MLGGRISKTSNSVSLIAAKVKEQLGLELSAEESRAEAALLRGTK